MIVYLIHWLAMSFLQLMCLRYLGWNKHQLRRHSHDHWSSRSTEIFKYFASLVGNEVKEQASDVLKSCIKERVLLTELLEYATGGFIGVNLTWVSE